MHKANNTARREIQLSLDDSRKTFALNDFAYDPDEINIFLDVVETMGRTDPPCLKELRDYLASLPKHGCITTLNLALDARADAITLTVGTACSLSTMVPTSHAPTFRLLPYRDLTVKGLSSTFAHQLLALFKNRPQVKYLEAFKINPTKRNQARGFVTEPIKWREVVDQLCDALRYDPDSEVPQHIHLGTNLLSAIDPSVTVALLPRVKKPKP